MIYRRFNALRLIRKTSGNTDSYELCRGNQVTEHAQDSSIHVTVIYSDRRAADISLAEGKRKWIGEMPGVQPESASPVRVLW
jgi:hypothetical protein